MQRRSLIKAFTLTASIVAMGMTWTVQAAETIKVGILHSLSGTMAISEILMVGEPIPALPRALARAVPDWAKALNQEVADCVRDLMHHQSACAGAACTRMRRLGAWREHP